MGPKRTDRLASQLMREVAHILREKLTDPRLQWISVTHAEVTKDMMDAKIYIQTLKDGAEQEDALNALQHATGFVKGELGRRLNWRVVPNLLFKLDNELAESRKVLEIMDQLAIERDESDGGTEAGA